MHSRRRFLKKSVATAAVTYFLPSWVSAQVNNVYPEVACQQYPWGTFFQREGKRWDEDLKWSLKQVKESGFTIFEPSLGSETYTQKLGLIYPDLGFSSPSAYVNSVLHDADKVEDSIHEVLSIAKLAKQQGVHILVTNPSPISWGGQEDKSDTQLILQARALNELGARLRGMGMRLAYHNHDAEMRQSAREVHHMMTGTEPENVGFCLDAHWVYRGAGNSQVALFDIVNLYGHRVNELHLRQSQNGIWTEAFGSGDIDYQRLADFFKTQGRHPHLVMEQAVEAGSPHTMTGVEAHKKSLAYAKEIFS